MSRTPIFTGLGLALAGTLTAQVTVTPLSTFGTNGWLAPGSTGYLSTGDTERGFGVNPATGNLILVARQNVNGASNNVVVLDGATGAVHGVLDTSGVSGGTFAVNMADCDALGNIYVCNLSTSATAPFKIYRWADETFGVAPTEVYNGISGVSRTGDSFAVTIDTLTAAPIFAAAGTNNVHASNFVAGFLDASNNSTAFLSVANTNSTSNDYRLSLTFLGSRLIGNQGGFARLTDFQMGAGTASSLTTIQLGGAARRSLDFTVVRSTPLLAVIDSNTSTVSVLDLSNLFAPVVVGSGNATSGTLSGNTNGTGSVQWGPVTGNTATLYAMSTNQGIQAFTVTVTRPAGTSAYGTGCDGLALQAIGTPTIGATNFKLQVLGHAVVPFGFFGLGTAVVDPGAPLGGIGLAGCSRYTNLDIGLLARVAAPIPELSLPVPANAALNGLILSAQGVAFSTTTALGLKTSNGIRIDIGF